MYMYTRNYGPPMDQVLFPCFFIIILTIIIIIIIITIIIMMMINYYSLPSLLSHPKLFVTSVVSTALLELVWKYFWERETFNIYAIFYFAITDCTFELVHRSTTWYFSSINIASFSSYTMRGVPKHFSMGHLKLP